jgi:hypothetical protein
MSGLHHQFVTIESTVATGKELKEAIGKDAGSCAGQRCNWERIESGWLFC